ncbi:efflux RND transporter periplasmic adaptor subunit [Marinibaculum pumilum]|uniref:Efflux RND transporter periplasmic adaptor subunit n=1 Tax=Marinibaculum pumilum TaxID=1766165 RepID=A0ABV7KYN1_9PROT
MVRSYLIAFVLAVAAIAWIASGELGLTADSGNGSVAEETAAAAGNAPPEEAAVPSVRTRVSTAAPYRERVIVRGRTEAVRQVDLKAELPGRVSEVMAEKGSRVTKDQPLVRIALDDREHRLQEARATLRQREIEHQASSSLNKKGFRADASLAQDRAELDAARARVKAMEVELDKLLITAPFDGVLEERWVEIGAFVDKGTQIARIIDEDPFLIVGQVSEANVGRLNVGDVGGARLATGQVVEGRIRRIGSSADPETRTFRVELEIPNPQHRLLEGVTADIAFEVGTSDAHFITPAILTLDAAGTIGLRMIGPDGRVVFQPVQILGDEGEGVWVSGPPPEAELITVGQELVAAGDQVRVVREQSGS